MTALSAALHLLDTSQPLAGKFQVSDDIDFLRFASDENFAKRTWTIALTTPLREQGPDLTPLSWLTQIGTYLQCRQGKPTNTGRSAICPPGDHLLSLRSYGPAAARYSLTFIATGTVKDHFESEPNDPVAQANPIAISGDEAGDEGGAMRGHLAGQDDDFYTFVVSGEPPNCGASKHWAMACNRSTILDATGHADPDRARRSASAASA